MSDHTTLADLLAEEVEAGDSRIEQRHQEELRAAQPPAQPQPPVQPARQAQPPAPERPLTVAANLAMLDRDLAATLREIEALEAKLEDPQKSYVLEGGNFDGAAFQGDTIRLGRLQRQYSQKETRRRQVGEEAQRWASFAERRAVNFLRGNMASVPEALRPTLRKTFAADFENLKAQGYWSHPDTQTEAAIATAIEGLFDKALGAAQRSAGSRPPASPEREKGLDASHNPVVPPVDDGFGTDETARQIFNNWQQGRQNKNLTLGDKLRAQREALTATKENANGR